MTTVAALAAWMESFAPARLAEPWDNVGLLLGDPETQIDRIMTCLTVTPITVAEAIDDRAGVILSHHPILFRPVKTIRADTPEGGMLWRLAQAGVAVLSPHTAFDNTVGGINDGLARRFGLVGVGPLRQPKAIASYKVVVFTPEDDREWVMNAAFAAGAGRIGEYTGCSFSTRGLGTFVGGEGTHPTAGQAGRPETVEEYRLEFVCPGDRLAEVLTAVRGRHSYEEPAIDLVPLRPEPVGPGIGRLGRLDQAAPLRDFAARVAGALGAPGLQIVGDPDRPVQRVAVACGAGDDFLDDAAKLGADVLVTGEARFHRALEAEARGLALVLAGHHATERPGVEDLAVRLAKDHPKLTVWASRRERDPLAILVQDSEFIP
ncbi:MAG: Nif3-like dinuclear metal center hexameric protein [Isosphaeraceae bacterium]